MNIPDRADLLDGLRKVQRTLCVYDLYPAVPANALPPAGYCGCKYGATHVAGHSEVGNGCPEVAAAVALLEALSPGEWSMLSMRLWDAAQRRIMGQLVADTTTMADPPPGRRQFMETRKVVYSDAQGVYLGPGAGTFGHWSRTNPGGQTSAPTFMTEEEVAAHFAQYQVEAPEHRLVQVFCSLPDGRASPEDCVNSMLPRWNPDGSPT